MTFDFVKARFLSIVNFRDKSGYSIIFNLLEYYILANSDIFNNYYSWWIEFYLILFKSVIKFDTFLFCLLLNSLYNKYSLSIEFVISTNF